MKRLFASLFLPHAIAFKIMNNSAVMEELANDNGNWAVGWNERMVYYKDMEGTILIAFIPGENTDELPLFFKKAEENPMFFVFTETKVFTNKAKTPGGKETFAIIPREELTPERIIETIKFMRSEFP